MLNAALTSQSVVDAWAASIEGLSKARVNPYFDKGLHDGHGVSASGAFGITLVCRFTESSHGSQLHVIKASMLAANVDKVAPGRHRQGGCTEPNPVNAALDLH